MITARKLYAMTCVIFTGNNVLRTDSSLRLVTAIWLLSMVVIINAYTGVLTAILSIPKLEKTIETMDELANSTRFKITKEVDNFMTIQLLVNHFGGIS